MKQSFYTFCPQCQLPTLYPDLYCSECNIQFKLDDSLAIKADQISHAITNQNKLMYAKCEEWINLLQNEQSIQIDVDKSLFASHYDYYKFRDRYNIPIPMDELMETKKLTLFRDYFVVMDAKGTHQFRYEDIYSVTTSSNFLELKIRKFPVLHLKFRHFSPYFILKIIEHYLQSTIYNETIYEFQPQILKSSDYLKRNFSPDGLLRKIRGTDNKSTPGSLNYPKLLWSVAKISLLPLLRYYFRLKVNHMTEIPENSPYILLVNHQSYIDPFLVYSAIPHHNLPAFITKTHSFQSRLNRKVLSAFSAIPARRFEVDPGVTRMLFFCKKNNIPVGIFPEGERTWTGELLPFKFNTMRHLLLFKDWPFYLAVIKNGFDNWPRWLSGPRIQKDTFLEFHGPYDISPFTKPYQLKLFLENAFREFLQS